MTQNVRDKVVVITGASSGLGAEAARHLAREKAKVVLGARREDRLEALAEEIGVGKNAIVKTDVTDKDQVRALVERAVEVHGRVDVMLNNAGLMPLSPLEMLRVDEWDQMIDVNIKGVLYGIAAALPHMKKQKSGHVINVSSVAGHVITPGGGVYSATKHAVRILSEALRREVKPYNIRSTIISPGAVESELPASVKAEDVAPSIADYYAEHAIGADSFARCVLFAIDQPADVDVNEILFRPTSQDI